MKQFGLIGFPLSHSFSKKYFEEKFQREKITDCSYNLFELKTIEEFPALLKSNPALLGLNVTIPQKEAVIKYLDVLSDEAKQIGAVNCIKIENGKLKGYNTDAFGFETSLQNVLNAIPNQTFVLGSGGSSKAVCNVLKKLNLPFIQVSREKKSGCVSYQEISPLMKEGNLFINTTPLGMFPNENECPNIPYDKLSTRDFLFDLVYNPTETLFLNKGKQAEAKTQNGLAMLQLQAEKSWEIWNNK